MKANLNSKGEKCLFCGKEKTWKSEIVIFISGQSHLVTVCPEDRKTHTIQELYIETINQNLREMQKVIEAYDKKREAFKENVLSSITQQEKKENP